MSWFQLKGPLLIIIYEDLIKSPETELRKMIQFLGFPDTRMHCAIEALPLKPHSTMSPERVGQLFTPGQIHEIETYREKVFHMANMIIRRRFLNRTSRIWQQLLIIYGCLEFTNEVGHRNAFRPFENVESPIPNWIIRLINSGFSKEVYLA